MRSITPSEICVGIVGLGLMGSSIIVSLLKAGHKVVAVAPIEGEVDIAPARIYEQMVKCNEFNLLDHPIEYYFKQLTITSEYKMLSACNLVLECVVEKVEIKKKVYQLIDAVVGDTTVVASNTSAIPISELQLLISNPGRFVGIHWAEPAYATRFLEITCGNKTLRKYTKWICQLALSWDKEPTLLMKDIHGFITNRLMYAVYRETFSLVESGKVSMEDVDKAFRYDWGSWMTLMGIFMRMDYLGVHNYANTFRNTFPLLNNSSEVPAIMQWLVEKDARGIHNNIGLYNYSSEESQRWNEAFKDFNGAIYKLASTYSINQLKREEIQ